MFKALKKESAKSPTEQTSKHRGRPARRNLMAGELGMSAEKTGNWEDLMMGPPAFSPTKTPQKPPICPPSPIENLRDGVGGQRRSLFPSNSLPCSPYGKGATGIVTWSPAKDPRQCPIGTPTRKHLHIPEDRSPFPSPSKRTPQLPYTTLASPSKLMACSTLLPGNQSQSAGGVHAREFIRRQAERLEAEAKEKEQEVIAKRTEAAALRKILFEQTCQEGSWRSGVVARRPLAASSLETDAYQTALVQDSLGRLAAGRDGRPALERERLVQVLEMPGTTLSVSQLRDEELLALVEERAGSRWLQQRIQAEFPSALCRLATLLLPHFPRLVNHRYANYIIQKMIEVDEKSGRAAIEGRVLDEVRNMLPEIAEEKHGCRVLQTALVSPTTQLPSLLNAMSGHVIPMITHQFGNHVIQKVIEVLVKEQEKPEKERREGLSLDWMVTEVGSEGKSGLLRLSRDVYGCRVIQKLLQESPESAKVGEKLAPLMSGEVVSLSFHEYGNYVIQWLIERGGEPEVREVVKELCGHVVELSANEHASHVVERALDRAKPDQRRLLIQEMFRVVAGGNGVREVTALEHCLVHQYANYVVQVMVKLAEGEQRYQLLSLLQRQQPNLQRYNYGPRILGNLEKYFQELSISHRRISSNLRH